MSWMKKEATVTTAQMMKATSINIPRLLKDQTEPPTKLMVLISKRRESTIRVGVMIVITLRAFRANLFCPTSYKL